MIAQEFIFQMPVVEMMHLWQINLLLKETVDLYNKYKTKAIYGLLEKTSQFWIICYLDNITILDPFMLLCRKAIMNYA